MSTEKRIRYAIYARYSSEMQNEKSLHEQILLCKQEIAKRGGAVTNTYTDSAKTGWSLGREGFTDMQRAAEAGKFDALMMWKFDRLARGHDDAVVIKMLLRRNYGLKLFCVEGVSEDDDDSAYSALVEQMLAVFAAFYSRNLSSDVKRSKYSRALEGEFNGSTPPIGYYLVTVAESTLEKPAGLYIDPRLAALVRRAFRLYATGEYSDRDIAEWLNQRTIIKKLREGHKPIGKEMVRDMLKNRAYTGRVQYCETIYTAGFGQGKRATRNRKDWFEGKHEGFISDELYDLCQAAREQRIKHRKSSSQMRTYILHDRVYCARCVAITPAGLVDDKYGKMRPYYQKQDDIEYYRCMARDRGYKKCGQKAVHTSTIDEQVIAILSSLKVPDDYRPAIEMEVQNRVDHQASLERIEEIRKIVKRVDFQWEQGFIEPHEYLEKREQLQQEIDALQPIDFDDLIEAADLLENFNTYWAECENVGNPQEARKQLVSKIVERVFVYGGKVLAVSLYGDFAVVLGENKKAPGEVTEAVKSSLGNAGVMSIEINSRFGSDGDCTSHSHPMIFTCVYTRHYTVISGRNKLPVISAPVRTMTVIIRVGLWVVIVTVRC